MKLSCKRIDFTYTPGEEIFAFPDESGLPFLFDVEKELTADPMLVGRELEELCWEPVTMDDPRLSAHPDWLKQFRDFAWSDLDSLTMHQSARIERTEEGFQICIYNRTDYDELFAGCLLYTSWANPSGI